MRSASIANLAIGYHRSGATMGYVTDRRVEPHTQRCKTFEYGVLLDNDPKGTLLGSGQLSPTQVTTGFRSGRAVKDRSDSHEDAIFNVSNQAEAFAYLKEDADHYAAQSDFDTGHEFDTVSKRLICSPVVSVNFGAFGTVKPWRYEGPFYADPSYSSISASWLNADDVNASYYGPAAIQACAPTHPLVQLAVDLAEFKSEGARITGAALFKHAERGRSIIVPTKPKRKNPRKNRRRRGQNYRLVTPPSSGLNRRTAVEAGDLVSDEWLNWQFGLQPIMHDAQKALTNMLDSQSLLENFQANSGKIVRRNFHFPLIRETLFTDDSATVAGRLSASSNNGLANQYAFVNGDRYGVQSESVVRTIRIWFEGAFTYYLQPDLKLVDKVARREQEINYLFGTRVTPEVLWNLQPWSWLADWNVNIGTNIANAERLSSDGLVMKYGYLMCETTIDHAIVLNGVPFKGGYTGPFTTIFRTTRKQRVKASPFGFSTTPEHFTLRQWSILGALGFTKSAQSLKTL